MNRSFSEQLLLNSALAGVLSLISAPYAYANPVGGQVVGGSATISNSGNTLTINQTSNNAIINWSSFNIAAGETTQFIQPSSSSIALNRIGGNSPSEILGTLTANGQVWLVNPNGVMFGNGAQVNVGSLVVSTANISDAGFMAGNYVFDQAGNANASISNAGNITVADAGLVAFVAPSVSNAGVINAKLGKVQLGSGDTFTLDLYGDGLINLQASSAVTSQLVSNSGTIQANGGQVALTAAAAQSTINSLINNTGIIEAQSIGTQNGQIVLYAEGSNAVVNNVAANKGQESGESTVTVSGTLDASGLGSGETGGSVSVLGDNVGILSGAVINASGDAGGGTIKIGGDFHGQGTTPTALATVVESGATIEANAITTGNGGNVVVWSDDYTNFAGMIEATGGALSGNGGYVETSGKIDLQMNGIVDASAPNGTPGTWLMDPEDVTISTGTDSDESGDPNFVPDGNQATAVINTTDIDNALNAGTNVTITTSNNSQDGPNGGSITVANPISATGAGTALTTTGSLTLSSYQDIIVNAAITLGGGTKP